MPYNSSLRLTEVGPPPDLHVPRAASPCRRSPQRTKKTGRAPVMMDLKRKIRRLTRPELSPGRDSLKTLLKRFVPAGGAAPFRGSVPALTETRLQTRPTSLSASRRPAPYLLSPGPGPCKSFFYLKRKKPAAPYFPPYRSIIGAGVLDFRVRNGNGYIHPTMATGI